MLKKNLPLLLIVTITATSTVFLVALQGQTSKIAPSPTPQIKSTKDSLEEIKKDFPSVEFTTESTLDENEKKKSEKYNKYAVLDAGISLTKDIEEISFGEWLTSSSPLPLDESDIVLLGKIVSAEAHLSTKKNSVYSEFNVDIEKIFKNNTNKELNDEKYIKTEREGGVVIFPTGNKIWYRVAGQRMPQVGSRYLLFLTHSFPSYGYQKESLFLLTGYELKNGLVFPLDLPNGGTHPIALFYKGKAESILLTDLENALKNSAKALTK